MRTSLSALLLAGIFSQGCQAPISTPTLTASAPAALPVLEVGQDYAVSVKSGTADTQVSYKGIVIESNDDTIVMASPTVTVRQGDYAAGVSRLPYVARLFKNVSIGTDNLQEDVTIQRAEILSADRLPAASPKVTKQSHAQEARIAHPASSG